MSWKLSGCCVEKFIVVVVGVGEVVEHKCAESCKVHKCAERLPPP